MQYLQSTMDSQTVLVSKPIHFHQPLSSAGIVMHKDPSKLSGMICQLCPEARYAFRVVLLHVHLPAGSRASGLNRGILQHALTANG